MQLHVDYTAKAISCAAQTEWVPSPLKGVDRKMLERNGDEVARATTIVRYAAGSFFSPHVHTGGEEFIVLDGVFSDEHGDYSAGMYVRNPVGSKHKPFSKDGCSILVKLWQMPAEDQEFVRINMLDEGLWTDEGECVQSLSLHKTDHETVEVLKVPAGNILLLEDAGGIELFVFSGSMENEGGVYKAGDWLRFPVEMTTEVTAKSDLILWKKTGHLIAPPALPVRK